MFAIYIPFALMIAWLFVRWVMLSLDATNGLQHDLNRQLRRLYTLGWVVLNLGTLIGGIALWRAAWSWPQPLPPLVGMFITALWVGVFFVSLGMLIKALIRRGGFDDPEGRFPTPSTPIHD